MRACAVVAALSLGCTAPAFAQAADTEAHKIPVRLSFDLHQSIETGADLTMAAAATVGHLGGLIVKPLRTHRKTGIAVRLAKTIFLDHPVAVFLVVYQHEAYGHGGRAREFGSGARFRLGQPWTVDALFRGSTRFGAGAFYDDRGLSLQEDLQVSTGGVQANARAATIMERELVAGGSAHPVQLLYLVRSRTYASYYVLVNTPDPVKNPSGFFAEWSGGGDVANYLGKMHATHFGEPGITERGSSAALLEEYRRIKRQAWVNVFEAGTWLSLWSVAQQVATGREPAGLPLPRLAGRPILPIVTADWLPDGGVISIETVVGRARGQTSGPRWFSFTIRQGSGPGGRLWSVGAATEAVGEWAGLRVGGEAEVWTQPSSGTGAGAFVRLVGTRAWYRGIQADVGAKGGGHWPGRPAGSGAFVRLGYQFPWTR